ncbi:Heavy metal-associated isoprenylated plant protein 35 [Hirschfeldia incana]|nr:Heavy metal-associated isoprenylated plant protein 35 [Hirschfeldia incana]
MATEEMKPETKKTEQKQPPQVKDLTPPPPALPYKTCNLKVSIHCEGCKRKVKKILTSIEGVYRVDIDVKQNNVTVMGIVSPEILLKKLHKSGKNADLLPEIPDPVRVENKPVDPKENKPVDQKKKNKKKKEEKPEITEKVTSSGSDKPESEKPDGAGKCSSGDSGEACVPAKEAKCETLKKKDSTPADSSSPPPEDSTAPPAEKKAEESSGSVGKKKKKKGQTVSSVNNPTGGPTRARSLPLPTTTPPAAEDHDRSINQHDGHQMPTNNIPPRQDMYHYPPNYYAPQVMYGVSYNVAQPPVSADAASYYSPAPPHSYAYMHPGYPPSDQNPYPSRPSDSFELFSDENPNGCSVM